MLLSITLPLLALAGCANAPTANGPSKKQSAAPQTQAGETSTFEYVDAEDKSHIVSLTINGQNVSGKIVTLIGDQGEDPARFTGKILSGQGTNKVRLAISFLPGGYHCVECSKDGKCVWEFNGSQLKVPMFLPIGRTGYRDVMVFESKSFN